MFPAEIHAIEIDVAYLSSDGQIAMLAIVSQPQTISVTLPRAALERLQSRIAYLLQREVPPSA